MKFNSRFHRELYETNRSPLHDPCVVAYLINKNLFKGRLVNVQVEENSELTRGKTVVDWLGVTNRVPNCNVITEADHVNFFIMLKEELSKLI